MVALDKRENEEMMFIFNSLIFLSFILSYSGADDLLPILSYVALRSELPQLVSECAALEEFIHEGWVPEIQHPLILF